jgi:4-amino-4-deoxy-L-arabinose transferase-like glycosyltransferase
VPVGIALATLAADRRLGAWREFAPASGPAVFAAIVGAWAAAATFGSGGEYSLWAALREHAIDRAVHGMHHLRPPWYYLTTLPVDLMPWTALVPGALVLAWRGRREPADRLLLAHAAFVVVFFSIPTEKRDLYVLPAFPAFAILVARLLVRAGGDARLAWRGVLAPQLVVGSLFLFAGAGAVLAAGGAVIVWGALARRLRVASRGTAAAAAAAYLAVASIALPALDPVKSARAFTERVARRTQAYRDGGGELPAYWLKNLPEAFAFYSGGMYTREILDPALLVEHLDRDEPVFALANGDKLELLPEEARGWIEVVDEARLSRMRALLITNGGRAE